MILDLQDDLTEGFGAEAVLDCASVLVFVSEGYFESKNCMRELLVASQAKKELITVLELDVNRWKTLKKSTSGEHTLFDMLKGEIFTKLIHSESRFDEWFSTEKWFIEGERMDAQTIFDDLFRFDPIEWNRLTDFQNETLRLIAIRLLKPKFREENGYVAFVPGANKTVNLPPPREGYEYHMFCSRANPTAFKLRDEMIACMKHQKSELAKQGKAAARKARENAGGREGLRQTLLLRSTLSDAERKLAADKSSHFEDKDTLEELKRSEIFLLHLTADTWADPKRNKKLAADIVDAMRTRVRIVLAHEMPGVEDKERFACDFGIFFGDRDGVSITPLFLKDAGIYSTIACPLKGGPFREISLMLLLRNVAAPPRPGLPNPFQGDENLAKAAHSFMSATSTRVAGRMKERLQAAAAKIKSQVPRGVGLKIRNTSTARCYAPPRPPFTLKKNAFRLQPLRASIAPHAAPEHHPPEHREAPTRDGLPVLRDASVRSNPVLDPSVSKSVSASHGCGPDAANGKYLRELLGPDGSIEPSASALPPIGATHQGFKVPASPASLKAIWHPARPPPKIKPIRRGDAHNLPTGLTTPRPLVDVPEERSMTPSDDHLSSGSQDQDLISSPNCETTGVGGYDTAPVVRPADLDGPSLEPSAPFEPMDEHQSEPAVVFQIPSSTRAPRERANLDDEVC